MNRGRSRLPLAILVAVVAAGAATFVLLRPRSGLIEPAAVDVKGYFTALQLDRAEDYRSVQRLLGRRWARGTGTATLCVLRLAPPAARLRTAASKRGPSSEALLPRWASRCCWCCWSSCPYSAVSHARAVDVGLATQDWLPWGGDIAKSAGIDAVFAAAGRRKRSRWR